MRGVLHQASEVSLNKRSTMKQSILLLVYACALAALVPESYLRNRRSRTFRSCCARFGRLLPPLAALQAKSHLGAQRGLALPLRNPKPTRRSAGPAGFVTQSCLLVLAGLRPIGGLMLLRLRQSTRRPGRPCVYSLG